MRPVFTLAVFSAVFTTLHAFEWTTAYRHDHVNSRIS